MNFPISQIRIARPTDKLNEMIRFYHEGLQFPVIGSFQQHAGYDGVMLGMPDAGIHLEFTRHADGSPCPAPAKDNLLVLYFKSSDERNNYTQRFMQLGYPEVAPENPYWLDHGITIEDPDGWRVVLVDRSGFSVDEG